MKITRARIVVIGVATVALAGVALWMRPNPVEVDTAIIGRGDLETTIDADGRTRVRERYLVVAPVSGRIERLAYSEGARVRAGDIVARIAPPPLDSQMVMQVQARIDAASALALQAAAGVRVATAELDQRRKEYSRAQRLAAVGGIATRVVEECGLAQVQAEEAVRGANERLKAAEADVRQARAALAGRAADAFVIVRAPATGRILRVPERSERVIAAGTPLLEIGDPSSLEIVVDVLSSDGALIHPGDRVRLSGWSVAPPDLESMLSARVRAIEPAGYTKTSALGVDEQRVNIIIDVDSAPSVVGDGFRVDASIVVWAGQGLVVVPRSALFQGETETASGAEWSVFLVRRGVVARQPVRIGHFGGTTAEVVSGLSPGDEVIVFPSDRVGDGVRVAARK